jgi:hypothetical protein
MGRINICYIFFILNLLEIIEEVDLPFCYYFNFEFIKFRVSIRYDLNKQITWGLGIGDWGLGIGDWAQSPIPNPQIPKPQTP